MKKNILSLLCCFLSFYCSAQESKLVQTPVSTDKAISPVALSGIKSAGVKGCDNCNVSGKLASSLGLKSFTVGKQVSFLFNEKQNTLEIKYEVSGLHGKIKTGGTTTSGPYGGKIRNGQTYKCTEYGFGCPPSPNRVGHTKYEIKNEEGKNYLIVTFLENLKVEKGFFAE